MQKYTFPLLALWSLMLVASCKRDPFDATKYDDLVYRYVAPPPAAKEYLFEATINGRRWKTNGAALISNDTMTIKACMGDTVFMMKITGYKGGSGTSIAIGHLQDSAALYTVGNEAFPDYVSSNPSSGAVVIKKLDEANDQIEAHFDLTLNSYGSDVTVRVTEGYLKINYSPNQVRWTHNNGNKPLEADSIWARAIGDDRIEVCAWDTTTHRMLRLVLPTAGTQIGPNLRLSSSTILPEAYYYVQGVDTVKANEGTLVIQSISNNVVKGAFIGNDKSLNFLRGNGKRYSLTNGTFSAKY